MVSIDICGTPGIDVIAWFKAVPIDSDVLKTKQNQYNTKKNNNCNVIAKLQK